MKKFFIVLGLLVGGSTFASDYCANTAKNAAKGLVEAATYQKVEDSDVSTVIITKGELYKVEVSEFGTYLIVVDPINPIEGVCAVKSATLL